MWLHVAKKEERNYSSDRSTYGSDNVAYKQGYDDAARHDKEVPGNFENNDIDGAISQLYEVKDNKVLPLSAEREKEIRKTLTTFPVLSYKIDELLLYSDSDTEVRYTIEFLRNLRAIHVLIR